MTEPLLRFPASILIKDSVDIINILINDYERLHSFKNKLSNDIEINTSTEYIDNIAELRTHYTEGDNSKFYQICVWDNYCQFLWTLCYCTYICATEYLINRDCHDKPLMDQAFVMFQTAMKLFNKEKDERPDNSIFFDFPNPYNKAEYKYIKETHNIFATSLAFILLHEYSHFEYMHHHKKNEKSDELEADYGAIHRMFMIKHKGKSDKYIISVAAIIGLQSLIFLDNVLKGDDVYPDPDDRLSQILIQLDDLQDGEKEFCYAVAVFTYKIWARKYGYTDIEFNPISHNSYCDYLLDIQKHLKITT